MLPADRIFYLKDVVGLKLKDAWDIGLYRGVFQAFAFDYYHAKDEKAKKKVVNKYANLPKTERKRLEAL